MKKRVKEILIVAATGFALIGYVFIPVAYFDKSISSYLGKTENELLEKFGKPQLIVTAYEIETKGIDWQWWGASYGPKPTQTVTNKAFGYSKSFIIMWVYINKNGKVQHVSKVGT